MYRKITLILVACIAVLLTAFGFQVSPEYTILFEKAKFTMETKGDMEGAIKLFNEIIEKYPDEREYAAKSQLYIGLCYEKSGLQEAHKAYQKVIDSYPEQAEAVKEAHEKLSLLLKAEALIRKEDTEFNIRKIWAGPDQDLLGAPSPDGRYLSYVDWDTGDLAIYEIATGKKRRLTNKGSWDESGEYAQFSRWSPDGMQIVYDWANENIFIELRVIGIDGTKPRILYSNEEVEWAQTYDWSPDGRKILACFSRKDGTNQMVLVSVADGSVRVIKTVDKWPGNMCFSPDGRYIVYDFPQKGDSPDRDISLLSTDGSREIPLVKHTANDFVLDWAPDGKQILFASDRTGTPGIWVIRITEGNPQGAPKLVKSSKGPFPPSGLGFTMDGSFYYGHRPNKTDVYITEIDPETGKIRIPPHEAINRFIESNATPDYSPDGKYLAYISRRPPMTMRYTTRPIGNVLCIRSLETGEEREIKPEINRFGWPRWSPDGRSVIVVNWNANNHVGYYKIDTQTGNATPVIQTDDEAETLFGRHEWSRDGKSIFYGSYKRQDKIIYKIFVRDLESGSEKELYRSDDYLNISLSPDGQWLALLFLTREKPCLNIIPATGGESRELLRFEEEEGIVFGGNCSLSWTADGKYILFTMINYKIDDAKWVLCRISADGGEYEKLGVEMSERLYNLSVNPDGRHIAFSTGGQSGSEVWVMENFLPKEEEDKEFNIRKVWAGPDVNSDGELSPDGKYLSFTEYKTSGNLAIREMATGTKRRLTSEADWSNLEFAHSSRWSPDGKRLAYAWSIGNGNELRVTGIDGSESRILYKNKEFNCNPQDWTPDGKNILATFVRNDKICQIGLISVADGSVHILKSLDQPHFPRVSISPYGRTIVYDFPQKKDSSKRDIYTISIDGKREIPLVNHSADDRLLDWTPDGKNILFISNRTGTYDMWCIRVAEGDPQGDPELIKKDIGQIWPMGFTQQGSFYYSSEENVMNVFMITLDLEKGTILCPPKEITQRFVGSNLTPDWSRDGEYLAYISMRNTEQIGPNTFVLCIRSEQTGKVRELYPPIKATWNLRWSPDARSIFIATEHKNRQGLYRIDLQNEEITPVAQSGAGSIIKDFTFSLNGRFVFYVYYQWKKKVVSIMRHELKTGKEKELYRKDAPPDIGGLLVSPDGQYLSFGPSESENNHVIKIIPITGGEPIDLLRIKSEYPGQSAQYVWTPNGKEILFVKQISNMNKNAYEIWRIPVKGGESKKIGLSNKRILLPRFHPDRKRIAFFTFKSVGEVWVMENFLTE